MATSITKNSITAKVVFEDAEGVPVGPDAGTEVVWTVYGQNQRAVRFSKTQDASDATTTGTFQYTFIPTVAETVYVEAVATVGGAQQAARTPHEVRWVE